MTLKNELRFHKVSHSQLNPSERSKYTHTPSAEPHTHTQSLRKISHFYSLKSITTFSLCVRLPPSLPAWRGDTLCAVWHRAVTSHSFHRTSAPCWANSVTAPRHPASLSSSAGMKTGSSIYNFPFAHSFISTFQLFFFPLSHLFFWYLQEYLRGHIFSHFNQCVMLLIKMTRCDHLHETRWNLN